jgi:pilus assembly protein Flp/PilA
MLAYTQGAQTGPDTIPLENQDPYFLGPILRGEKQMLTLWSLMSAIRGHLDKFAKDEEGAALLEYTVLLVIILGGAVALIIAVGGWVAARWTSLNTTLGGITF